MKLSLETKRFTFDVLLAVVLGAALAGVATVAVGCTPGEKTAIRTAADVAEDACRFAFGLHPEELPAGVSLEQFCKTAENYQPFIDNILSARVGIARKLGTERDAGTD